MSNAVGSQLLDLQRDALIDAGVADERIYEDLASATGDPDKSEDITFARSPDGD